MWEQKTTPCEKKKKKLKRRQIWEEQSERVGRHNGFSKNEEEQS
jgi:hypothetical protein